MNYHTVMINTESVITFIFFSNLKIFAHMQYLHGWILSNHRHLCLTYSFLTLPEGIFSEVVEHSILTLTHH